MLRHATYHVEILKTSDMFKTIIFAVCGCVASWDAMAQLTPIERILTQVEQNNLELKAQAAHVDGRKRELTAGNRLPDLQVDGYYLPRRGREADDYTELQVSQSAAFPTVYSARKALIDRQSLQLDTNVRAKRQEILTQAKILCLDFVHLSKRLEVETLRVERAKRVFEQAEERHRLGQIGLLERNKASVVWLQEQYHLQEVHNERSRVLQRLKALNGGVEPDVSRLDEYAEPLQVPPKASLWAQKQAMDPLRMLLTNEEAIARQSLRVARSETWPGLTAGFATQRVPGTTYSGLHAGVSVPLWSARNRVQAARSNVVFQQSVTRARSVEAFAAFETLYDGYQALRSRFQDYEVTLSGLESDERLLEAYEAGELSFLEYHMERLFYRQAYDDMLDMQHELHVRQADLLNHHL